MKPDPFNLRTLAELYGRVFEAAVKESCGNNLANNVGRLQDCEAIAQRAVQNVAGAAVLFDVGKCEVHSDG